MLFSARDIFTNQMHFRNAERCFNMESAFADEVFQLWPVFKDNGITDNEAAFRYFGMDTLLNFWGDIIPARTFMLPSFDRDIIAETDTTLTRRNGFGVLEEVFKDATLGESVRWFKPSVVTPDDWRRVKAERFIVGDARRDVDIAACKARLAGKEDMPLGLFIGSFIGFTRRMLTFEGCIYACHDYPDMAEDMVETNCLLMERFLDQVLPHFTVDIACAYENITGKNGPLISLPFFKDVVAPRIKRVCGKLLTYGVDVLSIGSDGDIRPLLPTLLDNGVNCLSPYEVKNCVHPGVLLDQYAGALRIIGGVDKVRIERGREVTDAYLHSIAPYVKRGGFIPHMDFDVYAHIGQEQYLYYNERKRQMFCQ